MEVHAMYLLRSCNERFFLTFSAFVFSRVVFAFCFPLCVCELVSLPTLCPGPSLSSYPDATNTTRERRAWIRDKVEAHEGHVKVRT